MAIPKALDCRTQPVRPKNGPRTAYLGRSLPHWPPAAEVVAAGVVGGGVVRQVGRGKRVLRQRGSRYLVDAAAGPKAMRARKRVIVTGGQIALDEIGRQVNRPTARIETAARGRTRDGVAAARGRCRAASQRRIVLDLGFGNLDGGEFHIHGASQADTAPPGRTCIRTQRTAPEAATRLIEFEHAAGNRDRAASHKKPAATAGGPVTAGGAALASPGGNPDQPATGGVRVDRVGGQAGILVQVNPPAEASAIGTAGPAEDRAGRAVAACSGSIVFGRIVRDECIFQSDRDSAVGIQAAAQPGGAIAALAPRGGTADGVATIAAAAADGQVVFDGRRSAQDQGRVEGFNAAADGNAAIAAVAAAGETPVASIAALAAHGLAVSYTDEAAVGDRPAVGENAATAGVPSDAAVAALLPGAAGAAATAKGFVIIESESGQRRLGRAAAAYEQAAAQGHSTAAAIGRTGAAGGTFATEDLACLDNSSGCGRQGRRCGRIGKNAAAAGGAAEGARAGSGLTANDMASLDQVVAIELQRAAGGAVNAAARRVVAMTSTGEARAKDLVVDQLHAAVDVQGPVVEDGAAFRRCAGAY